MITRIILTICLTLNFICGFSQNEKPERPYFNLKLLVDSSQYYEQEVKSSPYFVNEKILQLYPTEKIFIEIETDKNNITSMKSVKENINPDKTISVELEQRTENKKNKYSILKIYNPFKSKLEYKAQMYIVGYDKWVSTNVLPVRPKNAHYETWGDVIITLVLSDWQLKN